MSTIEIRFGGYQPPASIHNKAARTFGDVLDEALGDAVRFTLDGNIVASGYKAADLLQLVESGTLDLCYFSTSYLTGRVPELGIFDVPFSVDDRRRAYQAMDGALGRALAAQVAAQTGFRLLGLWDNGFRHISNRLRPIREPADCRGMTIRTLFSDLHAQVFRLLGFEPVALDVGDMVSGIEKGEIDAQENPLTNFYNFGIHRHHPHITLTGHFFGVAGLYCSAENYERWPSDVRHAVERAARHATAEQRRLAAAEDTAVTSKLEETDVRIVRLTESERAAFVRAVEPVVDQQRTALGPDLFNLLIGPAA